jgi:hypothetical protein
VSGTNPQKTMTPEERAERAINQARPNDTMNWITGLSVLRLFANIVREINEAVSEAQADASQ